MARWVTCEQCHRQTRVKGPISYNTVKCSFCGHLQYFPDSEVLSAWQVQGSGQAPVHESARALATDQIADVFAPPPLMSGVLSDPELPVTSAVAATAARYRPTAVPSLPGGFLHEYSYWLIVLALIPLALSSLKPNRDDVKERFDETRRNNPSIVERWEESDDPEFDELISSFPGERIEGAFLPRSTHWHWAFAAISALSFLTISVLIFPRGTTPPHELFMIGAFTGTIGIFLLFVVQILAACTAGIWIHGGGVFSLIFYILKFIGFSYRSAMDPDANFVVSFIGFTCGVGLCEEVCKALPIIFYYRNCDTLSWRGAVRWGLATGAGFGVAEGISYCATFYNGIQMAEIYVVRFVSCVGLHAIWSASVALMLYKWQDAIHDQKWLHMLVPVLRVVAVPMVLHGLYDTVLKMRLYEMALATAAVSFAWLAWQIESLREQEKAARALASA